MRISRVIIVSVTGLLVFCFWLSIQKMSDMPKLQSGPVADTPTSPPTDTPGPTPTETSTPTPEPTGIDTLAPIIKYITLAQTEVDTIASSQTLTINTRIKDDLSGLQTATFRFEPVAGGTQFLDFVIDANNRTDGDRRDGYYETSAVLPKYSANGKWSLAKVTFGDNANNSLDIDLLVNGAIVQERLALPDYPYFINGKDDSTPTPTATPVHLYVPSLEGN